MKQNAKQQAWAANKVLFARRKVMLRMFLCLFALFTVTTAIYAATNPTEDNILIALQTGGGSATLATMGAIGNISGVSDQYTAGNQLAYKVYLVHVDQVDDSEAFPTPNASREVSSIPLNSGEYMHYFEAIDDTLNDESSGEKGEITTDVTNTFDFIMGGDTAKLYDFVEQYAGGRFILIYKKISDSSYHILGTPDKPMVLKNFKRVRGKESTSVALTFENKTFDQPKIYVGTIVTQDAATVAADATTLAITDNDRYQLTDNTGATAISAVSGIAAADYGRTIDILGSGGSNPSTIADSSTFVLIDGTTWTANAGSRISFKILDDSTLVEIAGSRVQT